MDITSFAESLSEPRRVPTVAVKVGNVVIGGDAPVCVQSMTTTDTNDVEASVQQSLRIAESGGQLVRLTTQGVREAESVGRVRQRLREAGCDVPIVADVHFNPNAALTAASRVEAVRINPGNYTGEAKRFNADADRLSDSEWHSLIVEKLRPLVEICKANGTALRLGVNHGSLSDRVMAKYGDTPQGMVASCIEYLDALAELGFHDVVISIKSSNTRVMVHTVRLLSATMRSRGVSFPLHLGVTEAGSDVEGRIKSAAGIGALLSDGLGDTIRVSLTEAPEAEIPVAKALVDFIASKSTRPPHEFYSISLSDDEAALYSPYAYVRRETTDVLGIGGANPPVVVDEAIAKPARGTMADWQTVSVHSDEDNTSTLYLRRVSDDLRLPLVPLLRDLPPVSPDVPFAVMLNWAQLTPDYVRQLREHPNVVIFYYALHRYAQQELRAVALRLQAAGVKSPLIACCPVVANDLADFQLKSAANVGGTFIDGLADGLALFASNVEPDDAVSTAFHILQATRARFSRTEFISCPGCGRTLYDIQSTVALVKQRMGHLEGLKIGVMGCIVNGIGEMADADYGYVGAGRGEISLYRGRELVRRAVPQAEALDALEALIRADGKWL